MRYLNLMMKKNKSDNEDNDFNSEKLIVKKEDKKLKYTIYIDTDLELPDNYREVFDILSNAKKEDEIEIVFNTCGGYVNTMTQFFHYMMNCKARIKGILHSAYSAGTVLVLCCDEIETTYFSSMMFHNMSYGTYGKISDIEGQAAFNSKQDKHIAETVFTGFLTKTELQQIHKGVEFWFDRTEIDKRLKTWRPLRQRIKNA